jgi:protein phosphatase 1 regulatory subunit 37
MIEESRLARTLRKDGVKKAESRGPREPPERLLIPGGAQNENEAVVQAQQCRDQLQALIARSTPTLGSDAAEPQEALELIERAKTLLPGLVEVIRTCSDSGRLDELLNLNDTLVSLVSQASPKPKASLQGLGLELNGLGNPGANNSSGMVNHIVSPRGDSTEEPSDDDSPSTPRLDKGKGKAPPEPEIVKPVLSPRGFAAPDSDSDSDSDEIEHEAEQGEDDPRSPTDL